MDHQDTPWWFLLASHWGCGSSWRASTTLRGLTWVWDLPLSICVMSGLPLRRSSQGNTSSLNLFFSFFLKLKIQCWILIPLRSSAARVFLPHPSSPARRGSTSPPKSSPPQEWGLKAWPAGPVLANKLTPLRGCSWLSTQQSCDYLCAVGAHADYVDATVSDTMRMPLDDFLARKSTEFFCPQITQIITDF